MPDLINLREAKLQTSALDEICVRKMFCGRGPVKSAVNGQRRKSAARAGIARDHLDDRFFEPLPDVALEAWECFMSAGSGIFAISSSDGDVLARDQQTLKMSTYSL